MPHAIAAPERPERGPDAHLLTDEQARALVNVGARSWATLVATADWLPVPIILGPRLRRWNREELLEALSTRAPRAAPGPEPEQLRLAREARRKQVQAFQSPMNAEEGR